MKNITAFILIGTAVAGVVLAVLLSNQGNLYTTLNSKQNIFQFQLNNVNLNLGSTSGVSNCTNILYTNDDGYGVENFFKITDCDNNLLVQGYGDLGYDSCIDFGSNYNYKLILEDTYGDGWDGNTLTIDGVVYDFDTDGFYKEYSVGCATNDCTNITFVDNDRYPEENTFTIKDCAGNTLFSQNGKQEFDGCASLPDNYRIILEDSYGDGWGGNTLTIDGTVYTMDGDYLVYREFNVGCPLESCSNVSAWTSSTIHTVIVDCDNNILFRQAEADSSPVNSCVTLPDNYKVYIHDKNGFGDLGLNVYMTITHPDDPENPEEYLFDQPGAYQVHNNGCPVDPEETCTEVIYWSDDLSERNWDQTFQITDCDNNIITEGFGGYGYLKCVELPEQYTITFYPLDESWFNYSYLTIGDGSVENTIWHEKYLFTDSSVSTCP